MKTMLVNICTTRSRKTLTREELRRARRRRIAENVVNVLLGLGSVAAAFYGGWLVGSGAIGL